MTAFADQVAAERPRLLRYARVLTRDYDRAKDLTQDTLCRALSKGSRYFHAGTNMTSWLMTIMHNEHVNTVRRSAREGSRVHVANISEIRVTAPGKQEPAHTLRDLHRALLRLPEATRQAVLLVGYEGLKYKDIAVILSVPVGTVRSRLSRGRSLLRELMDTERKGRHRSPHRDEDAEARELAERIIQRHRRKH